MAEGKLAVVAAGGTGGHMFPAEALSRELAARGWRVALATDARGDQYAQAFPAEERLSLEAATFSLSNPVKAAKRRLEGLARRAAGQGGLCAPAAACDRGLRRLSEPAGHAGRGRHPDGDPRAERCARPLQPLPLHAGDGGGLRLSDAGARRARRAGQGARGRQPRPRLTEPAPIDPPVAGDSPVDRSRDVSPINPSATVSPIPGAPVTPSSSVTPGSAAPAATELAAESPSTPRVFEFQGEEIGLVLRTLARAANMNLVVSPKVTGTVVLRLLDKAPKDAIMVIVRTQGLVMDEDMGVYSIKTNEERTKEPTIPAATPLATPPRKKWCRCWTSSSPAPPPASASLTSARTPFSSARRRPTWIRSCSSCRPLIAPPSR